MDTQADSARALRRSLDSPPSGISYERMTPPAEMIRQGDIVIHSGRYYTVARVVALTEGDTALYTEESLPSGDNRLLVPLGTEGVAVYRQRVRRAEASA